MTHAFVSSCDHIIFMYVQKKHVSRLSGCFVSTFYIIFTSHMFLSSRVPKIWMARDFCIPLASNKRTPWFFGRQAILFHTRFNINNVCHVFHVHTRPLDFDVFTIKTWSVFLWPLCHFTGHTQSPRKHGACFYDLYVIFLNSYTLSFNTPHVFLSSYDDLLNVPHI